MGIHDLNNRLIQFSRTKKGRIFTWALVAVGGFAMFIGILVVSFIPAEASPRSLILTAENGMFYGNVGGKTGYHLSIFSTTTSITASPNPQTSTSNVTFSTRHTDILSITKSIPARGVATLELKKDSNGRYIITEDEIVIDVRSGGASTVIYARIVLTKEKVRFDTTLERQTSPTAWTPVNHIEQRLIFDPNNPVLYRMRISFSIFDEATPRAHNLMSTQELQAAKVSGFGFTSEEEYSDVLQLWPHITLSFIADLGKDEEYPLRPSCIFNGEEYVSLVPIVLYLKTEFKS